MSDGLTSAVGAAIMPSFVFTILIAIFASYTLDEEGLWWYFISSLTGGFTAIAIAVFICTGAASATVRTAWKSRLTLKYAYKVAHRTGMQAMFFACGVGMVTTLVLFVLFEDWYGNDEPAKLQNCA